MNKQQNYSLKKDKEKIKQLEIENALLKQKLALIYNIANIDGYGWIKSEVIKELGNKEIQQEKEVENKEKPAEIIKENGNN